MAKSHTQPGKHFELYSKYLKRKTDEAKIKFSLQFARVSRPSEYFFSFSNYYLFPCCQDTDERLRFVYPLFYFSFYPSFSTFLVYLHRCSILFAWFLFLYSFRIFFEIIFLRGQLFSSLIFNENDRYEYFTIPDYKNRFLNEEPKKSMSNGV